MPVTPDAAARILSRLAMKLSARRANIKTLDDAYRGTYSLKYASQDFSEFFSDRYAGFNDNWCGIVADAPHERLDVTGIRLPGQSEGDNTLFDDWRRTNSDIGSDLAFLDAIISKRAFALVWGDRDGNPVVTWEHPSQAIVEYDPETGARTVGAKVWADEENEYAALYLPDEIWKMQRPRSRPPTAEASPNCGPTLHDGWDLREAGVVHNPLGKVPLVEVVNRPRLLGEPLSDIEGTMAMSHAINLWWAQALAVSDEATIGQRLIIGAEQPVTPILDKDGNVIGERPIDLTKWRKDRLGWIEDPNAKPHEWQPAKLDPFTSIIEIAVGHIAAQTRTPAHYLLIGGTMANVSADAMKALETGLVKRTQEKTQHFGRAVRDVFELIALVRDDRAKADAVRAGIVLWKDVENRSDAQLADAALKDSQIGLPLRYILEKRFNLPPDEIERVMGMVREDRLDPTLLAITQEARADAASLEDR